MGFFLYYMAVDKRENCMSYLFEDSVNGNNYKTKKLSCEMTYYCGHFFTVKVLKSF